MDAEPGGPGPLGAELRRRRLAAGMSLGELAGRVHYSKGYLSKIENGLKQPGPDLLAGCDAALAANGELRALAESGAGPDTAPPPEAADQVVPADWVLDMTPDASLGRREMLALGGALPVLAVTMPAHASHPAQMAASRVDGSVATGFTAMLQELRKLGQSQPPAVLLPLLDVQVHTLLSLAKTAPSRGREPLLVVASRFAEFTGWMAQEAGNDPAMARWTGLAVRCADAAGERELSAYAHIRYANAAMYNDDAASTVDLATRAAAEAAGPRVRGLALQRQAQGYALMGRADDCLKALDQAEDAFGQVPARVDNPDNPGETTTLGTTTVPNPGDLVLGWCLHDLGRSADAVPVLQRHQARIPEQARRARARVGARLALATAGAGDPDTACVLAHQVLDDAAYVDSATLRHDLRHLGRSLKRWRTRADVQELSPRLSQALRAS